MSSLSADTVGEESQNNEHNLQSSAWRNFIKVDEKVLKGVIEEIVNSTDNLPEQITEAAKAVSKISGGIKAIMIFSLCLLASIITNPLLFSGYRTARKILSGL